jgi:hypothetical protein
MRDKEIEETETGIQCQNITKEYHGIAHLNFVPLLVVPRRALSASATRFFLPFFFICRVYSSAGRLISLSLTFVLALLTCLPAALALLTYDLVFLAARGLGLKTGEAAKRGSSLSCSKATGWSTNATLALLAERTFFFSEDAGGV